MIAKGFNFIFEYDGSTQGNTDRAAFKTVCDTELADDQIISVVNDERTSNVIVTGNIVKGQFYYSLTNSGISNLSSFWSICQTEKAKSTVLFAYYVKYILAANKETSDLSSEVKNPVS